MLKQLAAAAAATTIILLGACGDDGPRTLAKGEDVDLVGPGSIGDQTMDISAQEEGGEVTGEVRFVPNGSVASFQCADTETDGRVRLGGQWTSVPSHSDSLAVGDWMAVVIQEGDPDRVSPYLADPGTESCEAVIEQVPDDIEMFEVQEGDDIETG
jgi:hypothetical protein